MAACDKHGTYHYPVTVVYPNEVEGCPLCKSEAALEKAETVVAEFDAELCAHGRGFTAYDEGKPLDSCNLEPTEPEQRGWAAGWMDRAWQVRGLKAEAELATAQKALEASHRNEGELMMQVVHAECEIDRLRDLLAKCHRVFLDVEKCGDEHLDEYGPGSTCPSCGECLGRPPNPQGKHADGCELAECLAALKETKP